MVLAYVVALVFGSLGPFCARWFWRQLHKYEQNAMIYTVIWNGALREEEEDLGSCPSNGIDPFAHVERFEVMRRLWRI